MDLLVPAVKFGHVGMEDGPIVGRRAGGRLARGGPQGAALLVGDVDPQPLNVAGRVGQESRQRVPVPSQAAAPGVGDPAGEAAIADQVGLRGRSAGRRFIGRRDEQRRGGLGGAVPFFQPLDLRRGLAGNALAQQERDHPHPGLAREPLDERLSKQRVGDGGEDHPLVVRHVGGDRRKARPARALGGEVERLDEAEAAQRAEAGEPAEVLGGGVRRDRERQRGRIGCDDHVLAQAPAQAQRRHAEGLVAEAVVGIALGIGRFRYPPGHAIAGPVATLELDRHALAFAEQRLRPRPQQQARHQIFEHRAVPRQKRDPAMGRDDRPLEMKPMLRRDVAFGDREEAGDARLGCEQVVMVRIGAARARIVADIEQPALAVVKRAEVHGVRKGVGFVRQ